MSYTAYSVPCAVEERHELSLSLGKAFAQSYHLSCGHSRRTCDQTTHLLELYREARREVGNEHPTDLRYGSYDAYLSTQNY